MCSREFNLVVLVSGNGSNLQAIINQCHVDGSAINIKAVICSKPNAFAIERAKQAGIGTHVIVPDHFSSVQAYEQAMMDCIEEYQPLLIVLAGFMKILSSWFCDHYSGRIINLHPSLLPKYKGLTTHQRVLSAGECLHGCTVHYVTAELDAGDIIAQASCGIFPADTAAVLSGRVKQLEHQLLPSVIKMLANNTRTMHSKRGSCYFISDLHLQENDANTELLITLLTTGLKDASALFILGDLFEVWLGDDDNNHFTIKIKQALSYFTTTIAPVYIIRGNRDFALGDQFATETGVILLRDPYLIEINQRIMLLSHGDFMCTDDPAYCRFRAKFTNPMFVKKLLRLPLWLRRLIAKWARFKSQQHTQRTQLFVQDVNLEAVVSAFTSHKVALMIHGHTHRPAVHRYQINGNVVERMVLPAWHDGGHILKMSIDGTFTSSKVKLATEGLHYETEKYRLVIE